MLWKMKIPMLPNQEKSVFFASLLEKSLDLEGCFHGSQRSQRKRRQHENQDKESGWDRNRAALERARETGMARPPPEQKSPRWARVPHSTCQNTEAWVSGLWTQAASLGALVQGREERLFILPLPDTAQLLEGWHIHGAPVWTTVEKEMEIWNDIILRAGTGTKVRRQSNLS